MGVDADAALDQAADAGPLMGVQEGAAARRKCDAVAAHQQFAGRQRLERGDKLFAGLDARPGSALAAAPRQFEAPAGGASLAGRQRDRAFAVPGLAVGERVRRSSPIPCTTKIMRAWAGSASAAPLDRVSS